MNIRKVILEQRIYIRGHVIRFAVNDIGELFMLIPEELKDNVNFIKYDNKLTGFGQLTTQPSSSTPLDSSPRSLHEDEGSHFPLDQRSGGGFPSQDPFSKLREH